MASIQAWMGEGLQGAGCSPAQSPNPVINYGQPFGHPHENDIDDLLNNCDCSIYNEKILFDLSDPDQYGVLLSCCHEVVFVYYRIIADVDGRLYQVRLRTEKDGIETTYIAYTFTWDNAWSYYHGYYFFGWTPCYTWQGGSDWDPDYWEIYDNGNDYEAFVELWDTVTNTKVAEYNQTFTIANMDHTILYGDVENYAGGDVDNIGMKIDYDLPPGTPCALGIGHSGLVYYRIKHQDHNYNIYIDGIVGSTDVEIYHSGYIISTKNVTVTEKIFNELNFTGTDYLQSTFQGIVHDADDNPLPDANVWSEQSGGSEAKYGCKTTSDGKFALPLHTGGTYNIKAIKNNHELVTQGSGVHQYSVHPTSVATRDFTSSYRIPRISTYPTGVYAHVDSLASDVQSIIIPDDPLTTDIPIQPSTPVGVTIVKVRNRSISAGTNTMGTSSGAGTGSRGYGYGGFNYAGDMGDAEDWGWDDEIYNIGGGSTFFDGDQEFGCLLVNTSAQESTHRQRTIGGTWGSDFILEPNDNFTLVRTFNVLSIESWPDRDVMRFVEI